MNFLESHRLLPCVVGFAISAVLLLARLRDLRRGAHRAYVPRPPAQGLRAAALGGFGLWWPGHFLAPLDAGGASSASRSSPARSPGSSPGCALRHRRRSDAAKTVPAFAGLAVLDRCWSPTRHSVFATPGLFRATVAFGALGPRHRGLRPGDDPGRPRPRVQAEPSKLRATRSIGAAPLRASAADAGRHRSRPRPIRRGAGVGRARSSAR